jgi:hypothetical protein
LWPAAMRAGVVAGGYAGGGCDGGGGAGVVAGRYAGGVMAGRDKGRGHNRALRADCYRPAAPLRCAVIRSRYQPNEDFGVRCCVSKSTCTRPKRWLYPSDHSKLSIIVQVR